MEEVAVNGKEWIEREYDRIAVEYDTDGITQKEARDILAQRYEDAVRAGDVEREDLDLYGEGKQLFDRVINPLRQRRKTTLQNDMEAIVDAINDDTMFGTNDPILNVPYPLGTADGRDKILGLWTREDWRRSQITRYGKAAEVTAAAQIFADQAEVIVARMAQKNVDITFGLFGTPDSGVA